MGLAGVAAAVCAEHGKFSLSPIGSAKAATPPKLNEQEWWP